MGIAGKAKAIIRTVLPLDLRKSLAIWIDNQSWISGREYLAHGIIRDYQESDPKAFHKFLWANHIGAYAKPYDSETSFDKKNMEPSRKIFFDDIIDVIQDVGIDSGSDISSVLEVGCSMGYLLRFIETDILPNTKRLMGIDIDGSAIDKGTKYLGKVGSKVQLVTGDMEELDALVGEQTYDLVFAGGVLSYLNQEDATSVVKEMLKRTGKLLALIGLASHTINNSELIESVNTAERNNQWLHNFQSMVETAGGRVVKVRWEGAKQFNFQTIYSVYAVPDRG